MFFGSSGQAQRGIDLLVEEDGERVVYQCKNVKNFSTPDMFAALKKFELEWLQQTRLPKPKKFVLCITRSLRDVKDLEPWEKYREEFSQKHQIEVGTPWDRNYLNETLKRLPDIVAEIFSDQIAELFCERDDWAFDQFHPLAVNATEPSLKRYFARKTTDRLYLDPERIAEFTEKLERNGRILIKGLPGSGKTITSLALTEELNRYRVYYFSLRENTTNDLLVRGIKDRLSRRTIFLLDDCQGKFAQLDSLMIRIRRLLQGRPLNQALFVFLTRTTPTPDDLARGDEITGFEEDLKQAGSVLEFVTNQQTFRQIIEQGKPEFADLTAERLVNLYEFTGHDLFLLDQLLDNLDDSEELDDLNLEFLFRKTIVRYFGSDAVDRPGFMHLAALAQFDLAPRAAGFPHNLKAEDPRAMIELVAEAGHPLHYFFLHSSAAELIFRALAWNHEVTDHTGKAAEHLIAFFKGRASDDLAHGDDLSKAIRNRLKLADETEEERLKSAFLADDAIYELIERNFAMLPLNLIASCLIVLKNSGSPMLDRYLELASAKIEDGTVLKSATTNPFWESNLFLWLLKGSHQPLFAILSERFADGGHCSLLRTTDFLDYLRLLSTLASSERDTWFESLNLIPGDDIEAMFERTITAGSSIGTLNLALRKLKQKDIALLRRLEAQIGAARFLRLIAANGSIFELFMVIKDSTRALKEELIAALDDKLVEQLITQAISTGRSIGTLHWTLRHLKLKNSVLLCKLEEKIGINRWWRLICSFGSIAILVELLPAMDRSFQQKFIQAAKRLSAEEWKELLRKNGFYEFCYLVENLPWFFSASFRPDLLKQILVTLIQSSTWEARNLGWVELSNAPDSVGKRYLLKLIDEQFRGTEPGALDFLSFGEAAHAVNLLWGLLPTKRNELADALRRFIDTGKPIYSDPAYLASVHFLFSTLATPQARSTDARIALSLGKDARVAELCAKATTPDLFLYLVNLFALWFEWKSPQEKSFADFLTVELRNSLITSFTERLSSRKEGPEVDSLITLAGAMSFLGVSCDHSSAVEDFLSKIPSEDEMIFSLDHTQPFVPSVFFLLGLEWMFQDERAVPRLVWGEQLVKAKKYSETTAALEHLKSLATTRSLLA